MISFTHLWRGSARAIVAGGIAICAVPSAAQDTAEAPVVVASGEDASSGSDLAQQLQNPVASLIQVPIQNNIDFGIGPDDGFRITSNVQPVVPMSVNSKWNVISRTITPIIYQQDVTAPGASQFGLGDTVQSFFFSPKEIGSSGIIWGAGPVFLLPTGTQAALSGEKFGAGPTAVVLKQMGPWSVGLLVNQIWSIAGDSGRGDVNQGFAQPFASYVTKDLVTYSAGLDISQDWENDLTTIPVNLGISKLIPGKRPLSIGGGVRYYVEKPEGGPDWGLRLSIALLSPQ
ncbi:hypothetical protein [Erythrobacter sp. NFXS35]|uniref:hypothetical protein n=1 Tax=Erythrobacter sp. NFXS35 TaxID=2818436 RepID=UPI0032DF7B67